MINFDQFWAEAGCLPGLSKEETESYLRQIATHYGQPSDTPFDPALVPTFNPGPGVTADQIEDWERERGVRLPNVLRQVFARQDGGFVYGTHLRILPLKEIECPGEEFWPWASCEEEHVPDRGLVFRFAEEQESGGELFLNYNVQGPQQEPGILEYHSDPGDLDPRAKSITKFLTRMLETFDAPTVNWSDTAALEVIARETVDLSALHGAPAEKEQVLGRQTGALVLFTRERTPAGEILTRTTLPEPLERQAAMIQRHRPSPVATHALLLQPAKFDGIVELESKQTRDARWKNGTSKGAPICVHLESADRSRLEELRRTLFGEQTASRAQTREDRQEKLQQKMATMSPEQQRAAMMQAMLQSLERMREESGPLFTGLFNPETMPPQAAILQQVMQQRLREIEERTRQANAQNPADPEVLRLMEEMMKRENLSDPDEGEE